MKEGCRFHPSNCDSCPFADCLLTANTAGKAMILLKSGWTQEQIIRILRLSPGRAAKIFGGTVDYKLTEHSQIEIFCERE